MSATLPQILASEAFGTFLLILLGCGVVAGVALPTSKAKDGGWIVVTMAWGVAGFVVRSYGWNVVTEAVGTFVLLAWIIASGKTPSGLGPLAVALVIVVIGLSLGGPTGYAINPARDLGPRIAHAILPIPGKGGSDWAYSWVPVAGPVIGAVAAGLIVPHMAGLF